MNEFEQLLEEHGLTQAALHRQYGIPLRTMGHWKNGDSTCPSWVMNLLRIVVQHDCTADSDNEKRDPVTTESQ